LEKGRFQEGLKTVIIKNIFKIEDQLSDPLFFKNLKIDLIEECSKIGKFLS
jgi:hypothetical protein